MMQALTIAQAGAEGVYTAIADGMKAGMLARTVKEKDSEIALLTAKCEALENDNAIKDAEIKRLRKENAQHRKERQDARRAAWDYVLSGGGLGASVRNILVIFAAGMVLAFAIAVAIIVGNGWNMGL